MRDSKKNTEMFHVSRDASPQHPSRPELTPAGETEGDMIIRVPMKFKRDRGRKQVIAPAGLEGPIVFSRGQAQQALVLALARAHRWSRMLERGEVSSINELAEQQGVDPSLIGRTLRLATLAPDITQAILAGQETCGLSIRQLTRRVPTLWAEQRERYGFTAGEDRLAGDHSAPRHDPDRA